MADGRRPWEIPIGYVDDPRETPLSPDSPREPRARRTGPPADFDFPVEATGVGSGKDESPLEYRKGVNRDYEVDPDREGDPDEGGDE